MTRRRAGVARAAAGCLAVAGALACAGGAAGPGAGVGPAGEEAARSTLDERSALAEQLVPSDALRPGFVLRQRLRFDTGPEGGDRRSSFEAVVQVDCREVLVVGLTPFGTRLFTIRQTGRAIDFEWWLDRPWPFQPERILLDVHRSLLYPLAEPPLADGRHARHYGDVVADETWRGGRLLERTILAPVEPAGSAASADAAPGREPVWIARYPGGWGADSWPEVIRVESLRYGYSIEIATLEKRPLDCAP